MKNFAFIHRKQFAHEIHLRWLAVGRQTHDLVFLAEPLEADELAQRRVKKSQRMRHVHAVEDFYFVVAATREHRRGEVARTVVGKARRLIKVARKIRAGDMRQMMFHAGDLKTAVRRARAARFRRHFGKTFHLRPPLKMRQHAARGFDRRFQDVLRLGGEVGVAVVADGDPVHVAQGRAGHFQNFGERAAGKTADVLAARAEPLLSDGGDEFAVAQHARGGIGMKGVETDD